MVLFQRSGNWIPFANMVRYIILKSFCTAHQKTLHYKFKLLPKQLMKKSWPYRKILISNWSPFFFSLNLFFQVLQDMQQFAKAEEHFDSAIKLEPKNPVHLVYKGLVPTPATTFICLFRQEKKGDAFALLLNLWPSIWTNVTKLQLVSDVVVVWRSRSRYYPAERISCVRGYTVVFLKSLLNQPQQLCATLQSIINHTQRVRSDVSIYKAPLAAASVDMWSHPTPD